MSRDTMTKDPKNAKAPREDSDQRGRLWPHQRAALDAISESEEKIPMPDGKTPRAYNVMVEDESFYQKKILVRHSPGIVPHDPVAAAIAIAQPPRTGPEAWDMLRSECKMGYGAIIRAHADGTEVELTARIVVCRSEDVVAGDEMTALDAALDKAAIEWPRDLDGWTFSSRRGIEASDADVLDVDRVDEEARAFAP